MITIEVWKGMGGLHQIAIARGDGTGYRISGPKFNGKSKILYSHQITKRDADEIRQIVDKEFPTDHQAALDRLTRYMNEQIARKQRDIEAVERERDSADERARMLNFQKEKLAAALATAQGEVELLRVAIEYHVAMEIAAQAQEALGGKP